MCDLSYVDLTPAWVNSR